MAVAASMAALTAQAATDTLTIDRFTFAGPFEISQPIRLDSLDVQGNAYQPTALLDKVPYNASLLTQGQAYDGVLVPGAPADSTATAMGLVGFTLQNVRYASGLQMNVKGLKDYKLYVDGAEANAASLALEPGTHPVALRYLVKGGTADTLSVTLTGDSLQMAKVSLTARPGTEQAALYDVRRMMEARRGSYVVPSPRGDYLLLGESQRAPRSDRRWHYLVHRATGARRLLPERVEWMPRSNRYYYTRDEANGRELVTVDPATGAEQVLADHLPDGAFVIDPTETRLYYYLAQEPPKHLNPDVYELVNPEDRQPGYRHRSSLAVYDLATGVLSPLTFGHSSIWLADISADGRYALLWKNTDCFASTTEPRERPVRPTSTTSVYRLDLTTLAIDTLVEADGFLRGATLSPDGTQVCFTCSPEAFDRVGCTLPADVTPSMYDVQLCMMDVASRRLTPVTRDFDPSVEQVEWSTADGQIYFTAANRDSVSLYRLDPKAGSIVTLLQPEENVSRFALSAASPCLTFVGQSATHSDHVWLADLTKAGKAQRGKADLTRGLTLCDDLSAINLDGVAVAECKPWTFTNSQGDEVCCRYYLPVGFAEDEADDGRSFPMITYYYGGCSPTERNFESSYPWQIWAAQGYVVLVVEPSGAAGFGQEWASRHVNTAGTAPARDITEAVRAFCRTHSYVRADKVGCCGASYGGFMTQYLQTLPDCPFACAISHAGISDHTTYWGYGYWGYTYSEVSMAGSFPWSETDLYVRNSPIYNVDKIHTPILFLHGTDDHNVPINNSIQMFTALKLLGRETAMVCVEGEDHGITDYDKRISWLKTSMAWFAKYLQDDPTWWDALYPHRDL